MEPSSPKLKKFLISQEVTCKARKTKAKFALKKFFIFLQKIYPQIQNQAVENFPRNGKKFLHIEINNKLG